MHVLLAVVSRGFNWDRLVAALLGAIRRAHINWQDGFQPGDLAGAGGERVALLLTKLVSYGGWPHIERFVAEHIEYRAADLLAWLAAAVAFLASP